MTEYTQYVERLDRCEGFQFLKSDQAEEVAGLLGAYQWELTCRPSGFTLTATVGDDVPAITAEWGDYIIITGGSWPRAVVKSRREFGEKYEPAQ